ncbi:hypothetical protein PHISCL_05204 [Aspergillus sclerotialis]|uniref:Uncharacterized protein n=1 Tax=Aspergillus sclerotialis TaxID=2070753 RepID=A0A3A2ZH98_9EURO|nr:hypothetical protein PHISCL_05204 [Aspergillus sclerotialis]
MSCHNCPSSGGEKAPGPNPNDKSLTARLTRLASIILPEGSALLSSSCCWLPTVLDFVFAGSVTAAGVQKLRPIFLAISILTLAYSVARDGFTRSNIRRAIICACLAAWAQFKQRAPGHHSCH